ncbi:chitinase 1-like [Neltuma alba]|uniref:chitinase 1-like n=1 Tax=Neltuma alba TaxID=207710 RepID=UPI0010A58746|nr:chitinase 1-like [Prosopis alba]
MFRAYAHTSSQFLPLNGGEGQVVLAFVIDMDGSGKFQPNFNVKGTEISSFKSNNGNKFKFFLSMGGYSFNLRPDNVPTAVTTLTSLIQNLHIDGIDVYYKQIDNSDADNFVAVMSSVLKGLKGKIPTLEVSLTVPPPLNRDYYVPLWNSVKDLIDYVIYQTHSTASRVNDVGQLVQIFRQLDYSGKLLAGHSVLNTDWNTVPLLVFHGAHPVLLEGNLISGISEWAASGV